MSKKKLIEVSLPLEAINRESAREKSIRHGHPSTLHLWWARRPLAAARAVLFAQLVDDPSARPEEFPTEEDQRRERERLHRLMERLVMWENINDEKLFAEAYAEILKSTNGKPPVILDPFAGGGTIPLEAQRLGLVAHASDLNPVAVLINKALIEIPPKFKDQAPIFPGLADSEIRAWNGSEGLAADVRAYGEWMREAATARIGHHYPKADGKNVIAWIWARTVTCSNPACGIEMPLVRSWWLSKKPGNEAVVVPTVIPDASARGGRRVAFTVEGGAKTTPDVSHEGTVERMGATCVACSTFVPLVYVRAEGRAGRLGAELMATVVEGHRRRIYLPPDDVQREAARVDEVLSLPVGSLPPHGLQPANPQTVRIYGFNEFSDLFSPRQKLALITFGDLVAEARQRIVHDGGDPAYGDAVATYLALSVSRCSDYWSSICSWHNTGQKMRNVFGRQAIPMAWDYAEAMPFSDSTGGYAGQLNWVAKVVADLPATSEAVVTQADAASLDYSGVLISTDPPYYDNIGYSDLSDFFYVWLRRMLLEIYPELFSTVLVPKSEELVANPHRQGGKVGAKAFFEEGFRSVFARTRLAAVPGDPKQSFPITVWYAFKQSETDAAGSASSGWETLLQGMIESGWEIGSTWPNRSELSNRMLASGSNALASSIVLSLRTRQENAPTIDRRGFIGALENELPGALRRLQQGAIAPVDLPQAAIGPGMAVFSRYSAVLEPDGSSMAVRSALARINEILDQVLSEQEGDFDSISRFAIAWYRQHGYGVGQFGDADNLARARNTSVDYLERAGILSSRAGKVNLIKPADLRADYDVLADHTVSNWESLHHCIRLLESAGIVPAGALLRQALSRTDNVVEADLVKELAHLLFRIAESNGWTKDALAFNTLVTSWPEIVNAAGDDPTRPGDEQGALDFDEES